jgi:hypothetical protein
MTTEAQTPAAVAAATATPVPQTPATPEAPAPKKPDEDFSSKFAALSRKERGITQLQRELKEKEAQIAERERQIQERDGGWQSKFKKSPLEALKELGYSYEDITKAALNDGKFDAEVGVKETRTEIEKIRQELAERDKKAKEEADKAAKDAEAKAIETFRQQISDHVDTNKEKFELVALYDARGLVFDTIEEHYKRTAEAGTPKVLSLDEACQLVETYLEGEIERTAKTSKKFQSKYQAIVDKNNADASNSGKTKPHSTPTVSNNMQPSSAAPSLLSPKTEQDRLQRALAALG